MYQACSVPPATLSGRHSQSGSVSLLIASLPPQLSPSPSWLPLTWLSWQLLQVFHSVSPSRSGGHSGAASPLNTLHLVGVVCYYGKHYSTFFLHSKMKKWVYYDDATVREVRWIYIISSLIIHDFRTNLHVWLVWMHRGSDGLVRVASVLCHIGGDVNLGQWWIQWDRSHC